jgi:hypothetical protein
MTARNDLDILVKPSLAATRRDLFVMAAELEDAVGGQILIRADVEGMYIAWTMQPAAQIYPNEKIQLVGLLNRVNLS